MKNLTLAIVLGLPAIYNFANAQTNNVSYSDPVGYVTTTIAASGVGGVAKITPFSPVMQDIPNVTGASAGSIAALTSNTVTVNSAGWTAGALPSAQAYLQLTSGNQDGLIMRITSNTTDTLTLDTLGLDLTTTGIAVNNGFNLVVGETLLSMFGTGSAVPTENLVYGGTSSQFASRSIDYVVALDTARSLRTYYYDTTSSQWRRSGSSSDQGNTPIPPFAGVIYARLANTPITLAQSGNVPMRPIKYIVPSSGSIFLGRFYPADGTLAAAGLNNLSGWNNTSQAGVSSTIADKFVTVDSAGSLRSFFFNGTNWVRSGSSSSQNAVAIPAGGAGYTIRLGSGAPQILSVPLPYSL